jgi:LPXTG-motif cell wall-anchored protein
VGKLQIRLVALMCALGVVVTSVVATVDERVADAAIVSDPCGGVTVIGADGRSSSPRPETVVQVYPTGAICEFEQRVLEMMAIDRGTTLTDEIRGELLSYGRNEVRARFFAELFDLAQRAGGLTDPVEIGAVDWFLARYAELRQQTALNAQSEYDKWDVEGCDYEPPEGFEYSGLGACTGLQQLFAGRPNPPSYEDFVQYGASVTSAELLGGVDADLALATVTKALVIAGAYAASNGAAVAISTAIFSAVKTVIFPFIRATASALRFAGPAAILISTVVTSIIRGIEVVEDSKIPIQLAEDVEATSSIGLTDLITATTTGGGVTELLLAMMNATSPDYPTPDPAAVPASEPDADTPLWVLPDGSLSPTFTFIDVDDGINRVWVKDRWFVVQPIEPTGPIRLEPVLSYRNSDGREATARFVDGKLLVESIAEYGVVEPPECSPPRCEIVLEIDHLVMGDEGPEPATAVFSGSPPMIVAGPTVTGPNDPVGAGDVVTLAVDATDAESETLTYVWTVARDDFDEVTTHVGKTAQHRFAGPGQYTVTVTVTDEAGAQAVASVPVEVVLLSAILTARTQRQPTMTDWVDGSINEGLPGRLVVDSTLSGVCISVDWDGDGVADASRYQASDTEFIFRTPQESVGADLFESLRAGLVPVELVANFGSCSGEEVGRATVSVRVRNSRPYDLVVELFHGGSWKVLSSTSSAFVPDFEEGTLIPVRMRARDTRFDSLNFNLLWRPGGPVATQTQTVSAGLPPDGVRTELETTITALDQRSYNAGLTSLLVTVDDGRITSSGASRSYFNIVNVAPEIGTLETTFDNLGNTTIAVRVSDQGIAQLDVERISIDWGDGSEPEDIRFDNSLGNTYFFSDVIGHGTHRYTAPGPYTVTVTAYDDETSVSKEFIVEPSPFKPVIADITELDVGVEGSLTTLGVEVDDPDTAPEDLSVTVDWGDGSSSPAVHEAGTNRFRATRTYLEPDTYAVAIDASDGELDAESFGGFVSVADVPASVSIEQAATQADPTSNTSVRFDVVFSEPVTGFDADDLELSGTAGATTATVTNSGDDTAFVVEVSGMTQTGTVIADVVDGAAVNDDDSPTLPAISDDNEVTFIPGIQISLPGVDGVLAVDNDPGRAGADVDFTVTATGGSAPPEVTCVPASGSFFPVGDTTVRCTADDGGPDVDEFAPTSSLMATADFVVRVVDVDPPVFVTDPTTDGGVGAASSDGEPVTVTYPVPAATDNSGAVTTVCAPASGTLFPVGSTTVTCTVSDSAGNTETTSFVVVVDDQTVTTTVPTTTTPTTPTTPTVPATVPAAPTPNDPTPDGAGAPGGPIFELPATGTAPQTIVFLALALLLMGAFLVRTRRSQRS